MTTGLTIVITDKARRFLGLAKSMPLYDGKSSPANTFFLDMKYDNLKYTFYYLNPSEYDEIYFGWQKVQTETERADIEYVRSEIVGFLEFQIGLDLDMGYMIDWSIKKKNVQFVLDKERADFSIVQQEYKKRQFEIEHAEI
ncbi:MULTISPECIES: hypothetical protein [unclassified Enterococcus]|uniref:hypothetical protein n=1 Tax=unclassified Enterococcus TaxID=2608891 RepID=UPI0015536BDC|nr:MULTISPECIES: hypothetical protein [unclassified Enterococcus]MBS7577083.1 hypothetical protein [Enterococcus sp. MMGLQ5-2]MBS7584470.1 hypothetical protein [Enterococcus sp. MMGLQ5-1]NPD12325.1 hypothetical protein [Enterococcus sp. MMGLQ5-1]NPD36917.1 hypothetical protein [Enterococcus sp. MMGLQ5-2]